VAGTKEFNQESNAGIDLANITGIVCYISESRDNQEKKSANRKC
jgi:hypothetical protein